MSRTLDCPFLEIADTIPDQLFVLRHPPSSKYGCYCHRGVHGLACFSSEAAAFEFTISIDLGGMRADPVTFDEAREIAKDRPMPIVSLMLLDDLSEPVFHFVR